MANNVNLERLLTDFGRQKQAAEQPIGVGRSFGERLASSVGAIGGSMFGGLTQAAQGLGAPIDTRPAAQKLQDRLSQLNPQDNPEERKEFLRIVGTISGPEQAMALQQQFQTEDQRRDKEKELKKQQDDQRNALIAEATNLGLDSTVNLLNTPGSSLKEAYEAIYKQQELNLAAEGGRKGRLAVAQNKGADPSIIAGIKAGDYDSMSDELFISTIEGEKADIKAFRMEDGEIQSRRVNEQGRVWDPDSNKWVNPTALKLSPAPQVTKQLTAADGISSKLTDGLVDNFLELHDLATAGQKILTINETSLDVLDEGIVSGFTAPIQLEIMRIGKELGLLPESMEDAVAATELFVISRSKQVLPLIKALGSGTAISNRDLEFISNVVAGDFSLDEETIREVIRIEQVYATDAIEKSNQALDTLNRVGGDSRLDTAIYEGMYVTMPELKPRDVGYSRQAQSYINRIKKQ